MVTLISSYKPTDCRAVERRVCNQCQWAPGERLVSWLISDWYGELFWSKAYASSTLILVLLLLIYLTLPLR